MEVLIKRAQKGDPDSFVQLMEINKNSMRKIAYGFFREEEDVADVMQETVLDAYEHIGELRRAEYFKTWLIRILINNCNSLYNSKKRMVLGEITAEEGMEDSYPSDDDFFRLLQMLPRESRVIFQLFYGEQLTTREISEILHMNESTVRSRLHRGKEQLRSRIRKEEEEYDENGKCAVR